MVEHPTSDEAPDRLIIRLDPNGPIEVGDLTSSFASLARFYERHYRHDGDPAPKLFITRLETGSIIAEIAPYLPLFGQALPVLGAANTVANFTHRLWSGLKAFADPSSSGKPAPATKELPSRADASDLREFMRPLAGRKGASLGLKHARVTHRDGSREIVGEYVFDETEINRASLNIDASLEGSPNALVPLSDWADPLPGSESDAILTEVVLLFEQASRKPGKERGRTGDRGIIAQVSPKPLPVYFRKSTQNLKDQMVRGESNPLTDTAFVVDVFVTKIGGEPKAYIVTNVHAELPMDD